MTIESGRSAVIVPRLVTCASTILNAPCGPELRSVPLLISVPHVGQLPVKKFPLPLMMPLAPLVNVASLVPTLVPASIWMIPELFDRL